MKKSNIFLVSTQLKQKTSRNFELTKAMFCTEPDRNRSEPNRKLIFTALFKMSADERFQQRKSEHLFKQLKTRLNSNQFSADFLHLRYQNDSFSN